MVRYHHSMLYHHKLHSHKYVLKHPAAAGSCILSNRDFVSSHPCSSAGGEGGSVGEGASLEVFTTRPDTIFGATYMVIAPEHPLLEGLASSAQQAAVQQYVAEAANKSDLERTELQKVKSGVDTGQSLTPKLMGDACLMAHALPMQCLYRAGWF